MTLTEEYENQNQWRDWNSYLQKLPIRKTDLILDLGCGTGHVSQLLAERSLQVIGIDHNAELLKTAKKNNSFSNLKFLNADLSNYNPIDLPFVDGIWSSFTAAYFPEFKQILGNWLQHLKPGGWIALVEITHLFGHHPLSKETESHFKAHYKKLGDELIYDFEMGDKLKEHLLYNGLEIVSERNMKDIELSFNGSADPKVIVSWKNRLDRMAGLQNTVGSDQYQKIKSEFLNCLKDEHHKCSAKVKFVVARKPFLK